MDAGPVYMKEKVSLDGSAEEIFQRTSDIIFEKMIPRFLEEKLEPIEQYGEPVLFRRRAPAESELKEDMALSEFYDYIRMLDAEGYPSAFIRFGPYKLSFRNAKLIQGKLHAEVVMEENV